MAPQSDAARVDALVAQLKARVEERRRRGDYPPGLEEELEAHFHRIGSRRDPPDLTALHERVSALEARMGFGADRIPTVSRIPGGDALHRGVAKLVSRQTAGVLEQVQEFADGVRDVLRSVVEVVEDHVGPGHGHLVAEVDGIKERLGSYERGPVDSAAAVANLRGRVEDLEAAERRRRFRPTFTSERFEQEFRGTSDAIRDRYRDLSRQFVDCSPTIDIGCGRGEFLELLAEAGVEAFGVEIDPHLVDAATATGLDVRLEDGLEALALADDGSLGGISLIQVVEHLTHQQVVELVSLAAGKLRPGGKLVAETVNPQSLYVFAHSFYVDPTHVVPIHPAYLTFLVQDAGFAGVVIDWRSPPPPDDVLREVDEEGPLGATVNENVRRLNQLLFAPQDYALIATR